MKIRWKRFNSDGVTHQIYLRKGWVFVVPLGIVLFLISGLNLLYPIFTYVNFFICDFVDPDNDQLTLTKADGDILRTFRRFKLGLLGAMIVGYWTLYAELMLYFGGHRSWASHGWLVGTIGRMICFNLPIGAILYFFYLKGYAEWGWHTFSQVGWNYFYMNVWLIPYLVTQLISWSIGDTIHLVLDTKWWKDNYGRKNNSQEAETQKTSEAPRAKTKTRRTRGSRRTGSSKETNTRNIKKEIWEKLSGRSWSNR